MTCHHSVEHGEAKGGWLAMREAPVYMSHMDEHELNAREPKQQFGCSVETDKTIWPSGDACPGFARGVRHCLGWIDRVSRGLLAGFETVLGESPGFLCYEPGYLAFSAYPAQMVEGPGPFPSEFGLHEHSDATVFTLLTQREPALQIKLIDG